jgi:hypothetical protein
LATQFIVYLNKSKGPRSPHLGLEKCCERIYDYNSADHIMHIIFRITSVVLLKIPRRAIEHVQMCFSRSQSKIYEKIEKLLLDDKKGGCLTYICKQQILCHKSLLVGLVCNHSEGKCQGFQGPQKTNKGRKKRKLVNK